MRDRLIELLDGNCGYVEEQRAEVLADHLLANGVIVPPCKVGDFIKWKTRTDIKLYRVNGFYYDPDDRGLRYIIDLCTPVIDNDNIVGIVTKEEHEKALAERRKTDE